MENLTHIGVIKDILSRHGFTFSKGLGQNFLINPSVCPRMAEAAGAGPGTGVLEIGPGLGVLSRELCRRAEKVVAVEIDKRLEPVLHETLGDCPNFELVIGDVLQTDLAALIREHFSGLRVTVAANLPYYITTPILTRLLESQLPVDYITVMVQKEAAARLCALPGTRQVGAISLCIRYFSDPEILFPVSSGSFIPAPKVDSCVIRLALRQSPPSPVADQAAFFSVVRAAFGQRRKTLSNTLSAGLRLPKEVVLDALAKAGLSPGARAEELSFQDFARLSECLPL